MEITVLRVHCRATTEVARVAWKQLVQWVRAASEATVSLHYITSRSILCPAYNEPDQRGITNVMIDEENKQNKS